MQSDCKFALFVFPCYTSFEMKMRYIPRQCEAVLRNAAGQFPAVAVTGPRQSGKSTLLRHVFEKTHRYVTLDDPLLRQRALSDPKSFLEDLGAKAIIDEIQYVPEILSYVKIAIDNRRDKPGQFLLTGSQQFTMIKNLGDSLAGRIALLDLLPFSWREKRGDHHLKNLKTPSAGFIHACLQGSYPEVAVRQNMDRASWYGSYLDTDLERDVRTLYDIGNLRDFQRFLQLLAARTAQILNLSSFASDLGTSVNTIKKWISILEASRIIYSLSPYYEHFGKRITKAPKIYFLDCGLVCYLVGIQSQDHLLKGPMAGALFETFCVQETVKAFLNRGVRPPIFYLRMNNDLEIDLIVKGSDMRLYPYEIKLTRTPKTSMASSIQRFKALFPKLAIMDGSILSLSEADGPLTKNVTMKTVSHYLERLGRV